MAEGGGLALAGGSTSVIGSVTILTNTVNGGSAGFDDTNTPGGNGGNGEGGGIFVDVGTVIQLSSSTITGNIANFGASTENEQGQSFGGGVFLSGAALPKPAPRSAVISPSKAPTSLARSTPRPALFRRLAVSGQTRRRAGSKWPYAREGTYGASAAPGD